MNANNKPHRQTSPALMEEMEGRTLYAVSLTPSIPIPPPSPTLSRLVVVSDNTAPAPAPNVVTSIIAILIGL